MFRCQSSLDEALAKPSKIMLGEFRRMISMKANSNRSGA